MNRIKNLNQYQKGYLLVMLGMILAFTVIYAVTISRVGFAYEDTIFVESKENNNTVYSANLEGKASKFIVYEDNSVEFHYGDLMYGPYTVKEDPSAIPEDEPEHRVKYMTGVELYKGEEKIFRGVLYNSPSGSYVDSVDGRLSYLSSQKIYDENGTILNPMEPSARKILNLMNEPELTHKGDWGVWIIGVVICIINGFTIIFADDLFRFNLAFQIRNSDQAEPSDWQIISRYISWTVLAGIAFILFFEGLSDYTLYW